MTTIFMKAAMTRKPEASNKVDVDLRVLLISSIVPDATKLGGEVVMDRLLTDPCIEWVVLPERTEHAGLLTRLWDRVSRTRFHTQVEGFRRRFLLGSFSVPGNLSNREFLGAVRFARGWCPDVILTIAHGSHYLLAYKVSKRLDLPLVTIAHDWWPAKNEVPADDRDRVGKEFIDVCRGSDAVICVCEGMKEELGSPPNASVSYPQPSVVHKKLSHRRPRSFCRILYSGNLYEYGPMLESALVACEGSSQVRLEITGPKPWWTEGFEERARRDGVYYGLIDPDQLFEIAHSSDWILVVMSFDPEMKQRMRTSFPSKLVQMAQLGKPIVVWGPDWCSAVIWARERDAALCVTDPSAEALLAALEELAQTDDEQLRLAAAARYAAENEFNPGIIHDQFISILRKSCARV